MQNSIGYEHNKPSFLCAHNRRYPEAKTNPRPNAIFSICFSALCLYFHWRLHRTQCGCSVRFQCHFITPITPGNHIVRQVLACQHLQSGPAGRCTPRSDFSTNLTEKHDSDCEFLQVIHFEIVCAIFYTNSHELFCQFISWTNWVNPGEFMDNCWILCQGMRIIMPDIEKIYDVLIIINL